MHRLCIVVLAVLLASQTQSGPSMAVRPMEAFGLGDFDLVFDNLTIGENERVVWENLTVRIIQELNVLGNLTLRNSSLNNGPGMTGDATTDIFVSGNLTLMDLDGDPDTPEDGCYFGEIGKPQEVTMSGGVLKVFGSTLAEVNVTGASIDIAFSRLLSSTLSGPAQGITISGSSMDGAGEENDTALNLIGGSGKIDNVTFLNYSCAVWGKAQSLSLLNTTIINCSTGVHFESFFQGPVEVRDCRFEQVSNAIALSIPVRVTGSSFKGSGIDLPPASSIAISGFEASSLSGVMGSTVNGCSFSNSSVGMSEPVDSNLTGNMFKGCGTGIKDALDCILSENTFAECDEGMNGPERSVLKRNDFIGCGIAISLDDRCTIYHNAFIGNSLDAAGYVRSYWYNQTLKEGNYYSGYKGLDNGAGGRRANDGIGDTDLPYVGNDFYPLMKNDLWDMPPIPVLSITYHNGSDNVSLSWTDSGVDRYLVQSSTSPSFSTGVTTYSSSSNSMVIHDNPNGTLWFRAASFNKAGHRGWSEPLSMEIDQRPLPPVHITAVQVKEGNALDVHWTWIGEDTSFAYVFFIEEQGGQSYVWVQYPTGSVRIPDLKNGREYGIFLRVVDGSGQLSLPSDLVVASPMDTVPPPPPRNIQVKAVSNTSISISWDPPLIQDISNYLLFRGREGSMEMDLIANLSYHVYYHEDRGLEDNTTYRYAMISVDDDGPRSLLSAPETARTMHYNNAPLFVGSDEIISMVEDQGPVSIELEGMFMDPDGDKLTVIVTESFPFDAEIEGMTLWVRPDRDESGDGYIHLSVSDGEVAAFFLLGVVVEQVNDPPSGMRIISPYNSSVLLPGAPVLFEGEAEDPDLPYGDRLAFEWASDRDGPLLGGQGGHSSRFFSVLSPGVHVISLKVSDDSGISLSAMVEVIVSLWGWSDDPWSVEMDNSSGMLSREEGTIKLKLKNDSPLFLSFLMNMSFQYRDALSQVLRTIVVNPGTEIVITVAVPERIKAGEDFQFIADVHTFTLNGTFAGRSTWNWTLTMEDAPDGRPVRTRDLLIAGALLIGVAVIAAIFILLRFGRGRPRKDLREGELERALQK